MAVSVFDLFKIGIGPSSSHTVGPMKAACAFIQRLDRSGQLSATGRIQVSLYGSLAHTGRGHGTDKAVMLGLQGELPDSIDPDHIDGMLEHIRHSKSQPCPDTMTIPFREKTDLVFSKRNCFPTTPTACGLKPLARTRRMPGNPRILFRGRRFRGQPGQGRQKTASWPDHTRLPYPFNSGDEMLELCAANQMRIAEIMLANEMCWRPEEEVRSGLIAHRGAMKSCMQAWFSARKASYPAG